MSGRPTIYTPELVDIIIRRIETCTVGLRKLCSMYDDMPDCDTLNSWRCKHEDFSELYLAARKKQAHFLAEQVKEIAEDTEKYIYEDPKSGALCIDAGIISMQKMRIQANTWLASRVDPKNYGDRSITEHTTTESVTDVKSRMDEVKKAEKEF